MSETLNRVSYWWTQYLDTLRKLFDWWDTKYVMETLLSVLETLSTQWSTLSPFQIWIRSKSDLNRTYDSLRQLYVNFTAIIRQFYINFRTLKCMKFFYGNYTAILRQFSYFKTHLNSDLIQIWIRSDFHLRNGMRR